ncbi:MULTISPECIES: YihY/virulence factor BrkB family protein [unclassified Prochlorococcus]|uniref:YihY/virulence factor BrkB family protein n=1 Tax=unclassified Prochlorococcus TaxID=2627481 RepID=UPI0005336EC5|nr:MULTISPECIES: YihY/virulence factor BrkB family protein [unclassified Prochlorococcus]KGG16843.1 Ribonuclease BN family protein [Prochlorococcus sp. MIT 0602]KGG18183.1 Ribonuclease BN family protein [Prochlorococcus sp. MIT 0603]
MVTNWKRQFNWLLRSLWQASQRWNRCDCVDLSAAFAYYTLQSFFPILLISLSSASWFLGKQQGLDQQIIGLAAQVLPPSVVGLVETTLIKLVNQGFGAGILGAMFLIITAGNAYLTLQRGADRLWEDALPSKTTSIPLRMQAFRLIRNRIEAFLVVLLVGLFMVIDEVSSYLKMIPGAVWTELQDANPQFTDTLSKIPLIEAGQIILPFIGFTIMALLLQALVPRRRVPIRPLIPGAIMIGGLLTILNSAVSRTILSLGSRFQAYGIISGVLVLTLWIWLVGLIIYFGQCWSVGLVSNQVNRHRKTKTLHISI